MNICHSIRACVPLLLCFAASAAAQDGAGSSGPATVKLLTSDIVVAADGSSTQTLHVEMHAGNDAAAMRTSQVSYPFDAALQELSVVEAHTLKADGKTVPVEAAAIYDQMPSGQQAQMLTSQRSKVIVFPQFSTGDTAVYTVKIITKQPLFEGQYEYGEIFPRTAAYDEVRETITVPKSLPLQVESHEVDFSKKEAGAEIVYSWHYSAPVPAAAADTPTISPLDHMPRFFVSSFQDYAAMGRAYAGLANSRLAVTPKVSALADEIIQGASGHKAQAQKLYEWVSTHIRYIAIELGKGSFTPHDVDSILANGYGDCKDHDVILQALLKAKGIAAESILINGDNAYTTTDIPTFYTLNHVITFVPELNLYLDSSAMVAPFGVLPMAEYGKPMVIASTASAAPGKMPLLPPGLAKIAFKTASALDKDGQLTGTTITTASGPYAITLRTVGLGIQVVGPTAAASKVMASLGYKDATGSFTQDSPVALTPSHTISGTFKASGFSDILSGKTSFFMPGGMHLFGLSGDGMMGPFDPPKNKDEQTLCFSAEAVEDLSLKAPSGLQFEEVPKDTRVQTPNLLFVAHWSLEGDTLSVHRDFTSTIDEAFCKGSVREQVAAALKQIADSYNTNISFKDQGSGPPAATSASNQAPVPKVDQAQDYLNNGVEHMNSGNFALAIEDFDKALALKPDYADALNDRGDAQLKATQYALAIADFSKAIALKPDMEPFYTNRASAQEHLEQYVSAIADFDKAIALKPDDPDLLNNRGWAHFKAGHYALAIADLDKAIELKPDMGDAYFDRGLALYQTGQYVSAIGDFDKAIAQKPDDPDLLDNRGWAHLKAGHYALAISDLGKVLALKPDTGNAYYARGLAQSEIGQYDAGIADFDKAIALTSENSETFDSRGRAYRMSGKFDRALPDLDKAIALNPNNGLAYYDRGLAYGGLKQNDQGIKDLTQSIKLMPNYYYSYEARGFLYGATGQHALAIADEEQAIKLNPNDATAYYDRGISYFFLKQLVQAIEDCDKAITLKTDFALAFLLRGNAENRLGRDVEGNKDIAMATKLNPKLLGK